MFVFVSLFMCVSFCCSDRTEAKYGNIMYDRRVVRGNTYAQHTLPVVSAFFKISSETNLKLGFFSVSPIFGLH